MASRLISLLKKPLSGRGAFLPASISHPHLPALNPGIRLINNNSRQGGDGGSDTPKDWPILANAAYEIEIPLPEIKKRVEDLEKMRARLLYQSRKRGMAENDILISTFAKAFLPGFDAKQLTMYYDINKPSNNWKLYYWMSGASPIP